jgi:hypothetical protein
MNTDVKFVELDSVELNLESLESRLEMQAISHNVSQGDPATPQDKSSFCTHTFTF